MIIRPIEAEDNEAIKRLIKTSLEDLELNIPGTAYFDSSLNDLYSSYHSQQNAEYWVAVDDETIVGGIGIAPFDETTHTCELQKLYVAESAQGQGISRLLMDAALEFASHYYKYCYLETTDTLDVACKLYYKYGFKLLEQPLNTTEHTAMNQWFLKKLH
ncbi:GNAT family N-acetyltransferase [Macrococcus lamae]|uniref:GNAT family N-acetyltransferase n=1 Tax=Macrococcus lamae TaxID=198484 RepID=A0A4R6BWQ8_9STAP|nr:GNAT family N-acetyltransferase [Macrococcus lamae]TDM12722.1 GNAT family N-acetyltransferase [Macrococcus lamae]